MTGTITAIGAAALAAVLAGVTACGSGERDVAMDLARQSCLYPVPDVPAPFDPATTDQGLLDELAAVARARADLASEAATKDERWTALSDAAVAIAAVAELLRGIRASGESPAESMPAGVWDQAKYASDAYLIECRPLLPIPTTG